MTIGLIGFSSLYLVIGWGLSHQKQWSRHAAGVVFVLKVLLCVWVGRASIGAMVVFLLIASWDLYGLWVLLSKETAQLFASPEPRQASGKPANLVT